MANTIQDFINASKNTFQNVPGGSQNNGKVKGQQLTTPALPAVKQEDLKDPNLLQLNSILNTIWTKILYLAGGAGAINIPNDLTTQSVSIPSQSQAPTDNSQVITLGTALSLFAPGNSRTALLSGAFQKTSTDVQSVQPLPLGGSGGSGMSATINFPGGFTIGATTYFNMNFQNGSLVSVS